MAPLATDVSNCPPAPRISSRTLHRSAQASSTAERQVEPRTFGILSPWTPGCTAFFSDGRVWTCAGAGGPAPSPQGHWLLGRWPGPWTGGVGGLGHGSTGMTDPGGAFARSDRRTFGRGTYPYEALRTRDPSWCRSTGFIAWPIEYRQGSLWDVVPAEMALHRVRCDGSPELRMVP